MLWDLYNVLTRVASPMRRTLGVMPLGVPVTGKRMSLCEYETHWSRVFHESRCGTIQANVQLRADESYDVKSLADAESEVLGAPPVRSTGTSPGNTRTGFDR